METTPEPKHSIDLQIVENRVFLVRGQRVMLDAHLAELYGVKTKALNQAVSRNSDRFPEDFMFQLIESEVKILRSQIVTSKEDNRGGTRTFPYVFTELGIAMLSSVLRSPQAIAVNISIMRAFVALRQHTALYAELKEQVAHLGQRTDEKFEEVFKALDYLLSPAGERAPIGFKTDSGTN